MRSPDSYFPNSWPVLVEQQRLMSVNEEELDRLLAEGWRHFGPDFFRASVMEEATELKRQVALRIEVSSFTRSRSQRRTWKRNQDLEVSLAPAIPGAEEESLFLKHRERFQRNIPDSLSDFLGTNPDGVPSPCLQVSVRENGCLLAASFLACGKESCSSIYGIFDPEMTSRGLGIFTMLVELNYAKRAGYLFYYSGYTTLEPGCYDYKKGFSGLSCYCWDGIWREYVNNTVSIGG